MTDPSLIPSLLAAFAPAHHVIPEAVPWIPSGTPGKSSKPLCFMPDSRGFVELLRMEPGIVMPLHRHTGEVHAWNLSGYRRLCTGELIGPGDYVYELPGNTDWWKIEGDQTMVALVVVMGEVEFLHADGRIRSVATAAHQFREYSDFCRANGLRIAHQPPA